ncbi:hypothetical protein GDO78_011952 [Eleutherodactylus coqui]|uniref:Uncharacterized protein n=1 Tax=Eleutherodactylus coqui TaxID=57060 RepID=A0A8J6F438_ELECQ|nr:hypothetical protein GDO78_011952 [Eleutherodactylus coqui]
MTGSESILCSCFFFVIFVFECFYYIQEMCYIRLLHGVRIAKWSCDVPLPNMLIMCKHALFLLLLNRCTEGLLKASIFHKQLDIVYGAVTPLLCDFLLSAYSKT